MIKIFYRLFKFFVGLSTVEQVEPATNPLFKETRATNPYCRNWNGVDPQILPKLYSWISDNNYLIEEQKCHIECPDYQYKTQKYFNASSIMPYPRFQDEFAELCTMPCLPNKECLKYD